jgi:hypothetical protein
MPMLHAKGQNAGVWNQQDQPMKQIEKWKQ